MARFGVPVQPGFTATTEACIEYLEHEEGFPDDLWEEESDALRRLEEAAGKRFGDASSPLLLSCRSGARFSMPGMMDTILNLGMTDEVAEGMVMSRHPSTGETKLEGDFLLNAQGEDVVAGIRETFPIAFCQQLGLDYVSCSPFRVPVARLAAAHAALQRGGGSSS